MSIDYYVRRHLPLSASLTFLVRHNRMLIEIEKSGRYRNSYAIELLGLCVLFLHIQYEGYLKSLLRITLSILVGG